VLAGIKKRLGAGVQVVYAGGPMPQRAFPSIFDAFSGKKPAPPPTEAQIAEALANVKRPLPRQRW